VLCRKVITYKTGGEGAQEGGWEIGSAVRQEYEVLSSETNCFCCFYFDHDQRA